MFNVSKLDSYKKSAHPGRNAPYFSSKVDQDKALLWNGRMQDMALGWTTQELYLCRRIVTFTLDAIHHNQKDALATVFFNISPTLPIQIPKPSSSSSSQRDIYPPEPRESLQISCIFYPQSNGCFVTSYDVYRLALFCLGKDPASRRLNEELKDEYGEWDSHEPWEEDSDHAAEKEEEEEEKDRVEAKKMRSYLKKYFLPIRLWRPGSVVNKNGGSEFKDYENEIEEVDANGGALPVRNKEGEGLWDQLYHLINWFEHPDPLNPFGRGPVSIYHWNQLPTILDSLLKTKASELNIGYIEMFVRFPDALRPERSSKLLDRGSFTPSHPSSSSVSSQSHSPFQASLPPNHAEPRSSPVDNDGIEDDNEDDEQLDREDAASSPIPSPAFRSPVPSTTSHFLASNRSGVRSSQEMESGSNASSSSLRGQEPPPQW